MSLFSLSGIFALSLNEERLHSILFFLLAFSAGSIFGAAMFDLLPEAVELVEERVVFLYIAFGYLAFYFLERGSSTGITVTDITGIWRSSRRMRQGV